LCYTQMLLKQHAVAYSRNSNQSHLSLASKLHRIQSLDADASLLGRR
jgi:hypothetical protein